ncbi:MAG: DEAD/DEAH box helicase, partial [Spirochaetales bacterium]|nr:DEAD/DEAH box helicase [Spirochaetales bacterium]
CRWAVLDEADKLFENEAIEYSSELLSALPDACSRHLVSASLPNRTVERSARWFRNPELLVIDPSEALRTTIEHWCFHSTSRSKLDFLRRFEASVKPERCLLFASTNAAIFTIQKRLDYLGFPAVVLKSDKDNAERKNALAEFSSGAARWLITTDLGARGLDLPDVSHVISFDLPEEPTVYMHRAGRTGRAGKHGVSVALADLVELKRASKIAVRYGFPFVCKILDSGIVHDIEPENFFALAEEEEAARKDVKLEGTKRPEGRKYARSSTPQRRDQSRDRPAQRTQQPGNPNDRSRPPRSYQPQPDRSSRRDQAHGKSQGAPKAFDRPTNPRPATAPQGAPSEQAHQAAPSANPPAPKRRHRHKKPGPKSGTPPAGE